MRILLVNVVYDRGSTGKIVTCLQREYEKRGHIAAVCYGRGKKTSSSGAYKIARDPEIYSYVIYTRVTGYTGMSGAAAVDRLKGFIKQFRPDVIHLHNIHGYYLHVYRLLQYLKESGIPVVLTLHDEWMFTGKCGYSYKCARWETGCGSCPQKKEYPKSLLFDRSAREYREKFRAFDKWDKLLVAPVAGWLRDKAAASPILRGKRFEVVHNGIDLDTFVPGPAETPREKYHLGGNKVLLHVTPNITDPRKGGRYVLALAQRLLDLPVSVMIIGATVLATERPANVTCIAYMEDQRELAACYDMADALLMTSEMECLPTVCLESICCGTPVIGFDCAGSAESAPAPYGRLVTFGDIDALEQSARAVLAETAGLANSAECAEYGRRHYGRERMAEKYLALYGEIQ